MDSHDFGLQRQSLLGFYAHPGSLNDYLGLTRRAVEQGFRTTVQYHNLHSLYTYFTSVTLRRQYAGNPVLIDGMPVIWLMRLAGIPVTREQRLTYVDFIIPLMELARDNDWQVFQVGQEPAVQQKALEVIRERVPGVKIDGRDGFFDLSERSPESLAVIEELNRKQAKLLLVGFGTPKQETWVHTHRDLIEANVVYNCGACMEYVAGAVRTPPRWMGRVGLEWSFRLIENPRRFAFRYAIEPVLLAGLLLRNRLFGAPADTLEPGNRARP